MSKRKPYSQEIHPCVLCVRLGLGETWGEFHHIRERRLGKRGEKGIYLCPPHHRTSNAAIHVMGKRAWESFFGVTEQELYEESNRTAIL